MARLFIRHNVTDYNAWRTAYGTLIASVVRWGLAATRFFQSVDDPNDVTVWHDFSTLDKAKTFTSSSRLKEVMGKAGVKGTPQIWFVNEAR